MPFDFSGKNFLVTGAAGGIGAPLTRALIKAGGFVYALGRRNDVEELAKENENIHPLVVDLADWEATREALEKLPPLDGVVNNAARADGRFDSLTMSKDRLSRTLNVNVMAPVNVIQITAQKMIEAGKRGSIVNVSSVAGVIPFKNYLDYDCSKAAVDMITKQFALDLGPKNIRVNSVNLTVVWTGKHRQRQEQNPDYYERFESITPLGKLCDLQAAVDPILYLLSDHSSMVTGTTHIIDGGFTSSIPV